MIKFVGTKKSILKEIEKMKIPGKLVVTIKHYDEVKKK